MEASEQQIPAAEMERMMKAQEVILKVAAGKLKWWEAAEIMGVTDRTMRRWRERLEQNGYSGLWDYRKRSPSPKRVPMRRHEEQGLVLWNQAYANRGEPVQAQPAGGLCPASTEPPPFASCSTHPKRSQTKN